jgi:hypothetical protein
VFRHSHGHGRSAAVRTAAMAVCVAVLSSFFVLMPAPPAGAVAVASLPQGPNGAVAATAVDPTTGVTYVGGSFTRWGTQTGSGASVGTESPRDSWRLFPLRGLSYAKDNQVLA